MIIDEIKKIKSGIKDLRNFGFRTSIAFALLTGFAYWRGRDFFIYLGIFSIALFISALFYPKILLPLQKFMMSLAILIGHFFSFLLILIIFYLIVTPLGLFARLFHFKLLDIHYDPQKESYWVPRADKAKDKSSYENQF